jgi:GNAT superfamily N-acetyltransferase
MGCPEMAQVHRITTDAGTIRVLVKSVLSETVFCFDEGDTVIVEPVRPAARVAYSAARASQGADDVTCLECRVDFQSSQMWVDNLRVARSLRSSGIGRQLVSAAEGIALGLGLQRVNVLPLMSAGQFWKQMGYTAHPKTARVVTKDLAEDQLAVPVGYEKKLRV